ncbi:unnamed protein product [Diamesa hyperborea]
MADTIAEAVTEAVENITENANVNVKVPASFEGMCVAYGSLVFMALLPIYFGAKRSVGHQKDQMESDEKPDIMTKKDAMMFPVIASCALFGLYIFFKLFSKEYINLLLSGYFFVLGVLALSHLLAPVVSRLVPSSIPFVPFHIKFTKGNNEDLIDYKFTSYDIVCLILSSIIGVWYLFTKHWIANNLFGLAFAVNGVELLYLNNLVTGCILLGGLFIYDIFWVFGTNVMVTVAKSFDAPIKLVFPQDLLSNGFNASNFAMLGLGDIVIPGIFIALLLRFDCSRNKKSSIYFYATFLAYFLGLMATIFVMHVYKHAQPALLYLVPACVTTPILVAAVRGELKMLFAYEDHPGLEQEAAKEKKAKTEVKVDKKKNK